MAEPLAEPPKKKKRMVVAPISATPAPAHYLHLQPKLTLSDTHDVQLKAGRAATATVNNGEELGLLLQREAARAFETHEQWVRSPHAPWIQTLLAELGSEARSTLIEKQRKLVCCCFSILRPLCDAANPELTA